MNLRPRDRIVLCLVAVVAAVGAFYVLVLNPRRTEAAALQASIAGEQQKLAQAQQSFAAGRAAVGSLRTQNAQWSSLQLAVPPQSDIPALLRTLDAQARAAGVAMQAITLNGGSAGTTASATPATGSAAAPQGAVPVPIALTFSGGYLALDRLVQRLDGLVVVTGNRVRATGPLLSIGSVSLSGAPNLTVQIAATIYQLNSPAAAGSGTGGH